MTVRSTGILFTCEHASAKFPAFLPSPPKALLKSHRAFDEGALRIAQVFSKYFKAPLIIGEISRLAIDLNRSLNHAKVFSELSLATNEKIKHKLVSKTYEPFRAKTSMAIGKSKKPVLHISVHSFVPKLNGEVRNCDLGLLYDPRRPLEKKAARHLKQLINKSLPKVRIRLNYPYKGYSDGHTAALRKTFSGRKYLGMEIEFNQAWIKKAQLSEILLIAKAIAETKLILFSSHRSRILD